MSSSLTSRLGLVKPNPGTGEPVNVATQIGASYDKIDAAVGAEATLSTALPASPYHGKFARGTDNRKTYIWNATQAVWDQILTGPGNLVTIDSTGKLQFGSGGGTYDTNLYRSAADTLKTDDNFIVSGALGGLFVAKSERSAPSANFTTTEIVIQSLTFTAVSGFTYEVTALQSFQSTTQGESAVVRLRWAAGASVTIAGAQIDAKIAPAFVAGLGYITPLNNTFAPNVSGQVTVGITAIRNTGTTGTWSSWGASNNIDTIIVKTV